MKTRLMFIRHAEAEGNINRRFHGHYDSKITENGYKQLECLAQRIRDENIDVIYSSDLFRTFETAKAVAKVKSLDINKTAGLREIFGGEWEDIEWDLLPEKFPVEYNTWEKMLHDLIMPKGESMVDFSVRVLNTVKDIFKQNKNKNICIVTHGTAIKSLMCYFKGLPLENLSNISWHDNAALSIVETENFEDFDILLEGCAKHLGEYSTLAKQTWWKDEK